MLSVERAIQDRILPDPIDEVDVSRAKNSLLRKALITFGLLGTLLLAYRLYSCHGTEVKLGSVRSSQDAEAWTRSAGPSLVLVTDEYLTAQDLLSKQVELPNAGVLITVDPTVTPQRCLPGQPWLFVEGGMLPQPLVDSLNLAATGLEAVLGRSLFPLHLIPHDFSHVDSQLVLNNSVHFSRPFAVWDASLGTVLIDQALVQGLWQLPDVQAMMQLLSDTFFSGITKALHKTKASSQLRLLPQDLWGFLGPASAAAVPAAFALVAPPLWFCVMCPVVLGLFFPLLWNVVLVQAASALCTKMQLPDDECFDLLLGSLALAFVLSLASAIPIVMICKMSECAHREDNKTRTISRVPFRNQIMSRVLGRV